jgi:hypothetical protein
MQAFRQGHRRELIFIQRDEFCAKLLQREHCFLAPGFARYFVGHDRSVASLEAAMIAAFRTPAISFSHWLRPLPALIFLTAYR